MRLYSWNPAGDQDASGRPNPNWSVGEVQLASGVHWWNLEEGRYVDGWSLDAAAECDDDVQPSDFPLASQLIPIHSPRLQDVVWQLGLAPCVQYLRLTLKGRETGRVIEGYAIANYLTVLDCLDRQQSQYQVWTKENLLFWEKREWMLGTFRDIYKCVLDRSRVATARLFRLWGSGIVVVHEEVMAAIEAAGITGCVFREIRVT